MKMRTGISVLLLGFGLTFVFAEVNKVTHMHVGVKRKVDNCTRRSKNGDILHIHYVGKIHESGQEIEVRKPGVHEPFSFILGEHNIGVIQGWHQGMHNMCEGEKRKLIVPPQLAYGNDGYWYIPGNTALNYEVELVKIERDPKAVDARKKEQDFKMNTYSLLVD